MALSDIPLLTTEITVNGTTVTLRGLSLVDMMQVVPRFGSQIALVFGKVYAGTTVDGDSVIELAKALATEAPELVAEILALASDEYTPKAISIAAKLPFTKQIEMLEAVYNNTFASEADVKKLQEVITRMVLSAALAMERMAPAMLSGAGTSASGEKSAS